MRKKIVAVLLCLSIGLSSCGTDNVKQVSVPELIEPLAISESFTKVRKGDIGIPISDIATVTPDLDYQFFTSSVVIKEIKVEVGDIVKKGDVIAVADNSANIAIKESLETELKECKEKFELNKKNVERQIKELNALKSADDQVGAAQIDVQIAVLRENLAYDAILESREEEDIEKQIEVQKDLIANANLYATTDGTVSFIKDTSKGLMAEAGEIVVTLADESKKHLEIPGLTVAILSDMVNYKAKYTTVDGKKEELRSIPYDNIILAFASSVRAHIAAKFEFDSIDSFECGDQVLVYFLEKGAEDVLVVDKMTVMNDGQDYVYVRSEDGTTKRRNIEVGISDEYYYEVVSGLELGDEILYRADETIPVDTGEAVVTRGGISMDNNSISYNKSNTITSPINMPYSGEVTDVNKALLDQTKRIKINKGDYICTLKTDNGKAVIKEAEFKITTAKEDKDIAIKQIDAQIKELEKELKENPLLSDVIKDLKNQKIIVAGMWDKQIADYQAQYDELLKNNDGTGNVMVYSTEEGVIQPLSLAVGDKVEGGQEIALATTESGEDAAFNMDEKAPKDGFPQNCSDYPTLFEKITLQTKNGTDKMETRCIGNVPNFYYSDVIQLKDGNPYLLILGNVERFDRYVVKIDNKEFFEMDNMRATFKQLDIKDALYIPKNYVQNIDKSETTWVWVKDGDDVRMQHIRVNLSAANDTYVAVTYGLKENEVVVRGNV